MNIFEELRKSNTHIIIFGARGVGQFLLSLFQRNEIDVTAFCEDKANDSIEQSLGLKCESLDYFCSKYENISFIIGAASGQDLILKKIKSKGDYDCFLPHQFYEPEDIPADLDYLSKNILKSAYYFSKWSEDKNMNWLKYLDFVITERCSLKCKECSNLMQYYQHPKDFSFDELKKEIDRLLEVYDNIYELRLIGGEPFVNGILDKVVEYINQQPQILNICIYTNGTILPKDSTMEILKSGGKTWFSISDYGKLSRNKDKLVAKCTEYGIYYLLKPVEYWTRCSTFEKHNRTENDLKLIFQDCCVRNMVTLIKGKIYPCPYIANGLNLHALPDEPDNYVDLMKDVEISELRREVKKSLFNRESFSLCDYCNGRPYLNLREEDKISPYEQIKSPLPYKKF